MRIDADLDLIRETLSDERGPSLPAIMEARATLLEAIDAGAGAKPASRRRRPSARRVGLACALAAIAALAIVSRLLPTATQSAWAKQALRRAAAVVIPPPSPRTILHVALTATLSPLAQRASHTTVSSLSEEAWLQQGPPWAARTVVHPAGGPILEENNQAQIYDMTGNELYPGTRAPSGKPRYTLLAGAKPGTFRLRVKLPDGGGYTTSTVTAATVRSIRDRSDQVAWAVAWNGHRQRILALVVPSLRQLRQLSAQQPAPTSASFAQELRALLYSGNARVTRATTDAGKPAIEIASVHPESGPRITYYVDPKTYAPIELDIFGYDSPKDVTRVHFTTYQTLSLAGHQRLLRFAVPSSASVDHTPADYWKAAGLMNSPL
jgi:hypothetical protein